MLRTLVLLICTLATMSRAQILTWSPLFPTADDTIAIVYDATKGTAGLIGVTEVYAHTGVITNLSTVPSDWRYVKHPWNVNSPDTRMESLGNDKWRIRFHIRSFYGVPPSETILQLAFVFRSTDGKKEGKEVGGKDIFLPVYQQGLNITLLEPASVPVIVHPGDSVAIRAVASQADSIFLYIDDSLAAATDQDTLSYTLFIDSVGKKVGMLVARDASGAEKSQSFTIAAIGQVVIQDRPAELVDGLTRLDANRVGLSLVAPHKDFVCAIGDFSDWQVDPALMMNLTPDSSRYWLILENLQPDRSYRYQYLVDGKLWIADPFSELVLDPFHDSEIEAETFPDLPPYPAGKTAGTVSVFIPAQEEYLWQTTDWQKPAPANLVIYELLLRDFLATHSFRTLADTLGYLSRLGVNAVEIMPFNEFEGNDSWGYNPSFYFAPDKYYGRPEDIKYFVDQAHAHGIAVIQDIVLNHAYSQCPLVELYADEIGNSPWFNRVAPHTDYSWGYDFNHQSMETQLFVDRVFQYWLTEFRIDGFRLDFTRGFTNRPGSSGAYDASRIAILKRITDRIWQTDSTAFVILEHLVDDNNELKNLADYGLLLWGNMNYHYNEATMGYNESGKSNFSSVSYKARGWSEPALVGYMESHDEERLMYKNLLYGNSSGDYQIRDLPTALSRMKAAAAFFFTVPGPKMMWQFGELGFDYSIDYNGRLGRKPIRWDYLQNPNRKALFETVAALIKLRTSQPAFQSTDFALSAASAIKRLAINHPSMKVVILGNFDVVPAYINPNFHHTGEWYDYFADDTLQVQFTQMSIQLYPGEFRLYTDVRLDPPEMTTGIESSHDALPQNLILYPAFPNPFNPVTLLSYQLHRATVTELAIYNINGRQVRCWPARAQTAGVHQMRWDGLDAAGEPVASGVYFVRLNAGTEQRITKLMLVR